MLKGGNAMKRNSAIVKASSKSPAREPSRNLLAEVRELILVARQCVAQTANAALTMLHWQIGNRIRMDILREKRAEYGQKIVSSLATQLEAEFGRGFGPRNLFRMVRLAEVFPEQKIVSSLMSQLGWTHFLHIIRLDDPLKRDFYAEMCRIERWSTRTLEKKIDSMLFERTALSRKPAELAAMELTQLREEDKLTPDLVFRDPYIRVSSYWTSVMPKAELERKLHEAVRLARASLATRRPPDPAGRGE